MPSDDTREPFALPDRALWQQSRLSDAAPDEAERLNDLAAFADGRLDEDDAERVAAWLAADPALAGDIAVARRLAAEGEALPTTPEAVVGHAAALVPERGVVVPFTPRPQREARLQLVARWTSLVAAMAVASWLGFTLGMDTSLTLAQVRQGGEDGFLRELVDPAPGLLREFGEGAQT